VSACWLHRFDMLLPRMRSCALPESERVPRPCRRCLPAEIVVSVGMALPPSLTAISRRI
jgi:hypothetical protein